MVILKNDIMKNKKAIIFLLCCSTLANCQKPLEKQYLTREDLIEIIAKEDPKEGYPSFSGYYLFSPPNEEGELSWIDTRDLHYIYNHRDENRKYLKYRDFVDGYFKKGHLIDDKKDVNVFILNDTIKQMYEDNEFEIFMEHYSTKYEEREEYRINYDLSENVLLSVLYYAFLNDYIGFYDDIVGLYFTEKIPVSSLEVYEENPWDAETQQMIDKILKK